MSKTFLFQVVQLTEVRILVLFDPWTGPLSATATPDQSELGKERVLRIPQNSNITGTSVSDCLVSYLGHSLEVWSYPSAEVLSVYSTALADWARCRLKDQPGLMDDRDG